MKSIKEMNQIEVAAYVITRMEENNIHVTLSGGAATGFFSKNIYVSKDIDLVNEYQINPEKIRAVMIKIGFIEEGRHYVYPGTNIVVEFPPGPLSVGTESVKKTEKVELETGSLKIISATDCVKDRLAAFYHWNDRQCLYQARLVRKHADVDLDEIERWSRIEGKLAEYKQFMNE